MHLEGQEALSPSTPVPELSFLLLTNRPPPLHYHRQSCPSSSSQTEATTLSPTGHNSQASASHRFTIP